MAEMEQEEKQEEHKMHKVQRAIIMAAGTGQRMHPVTLTTPKPMVEVKGTRLIDTVIDGLMRQGITEIYIVIGYLPEKFSVLKEKHPNITLIVNPYYDQYNNISSLYVAREHLENVMIIDGDQWIRNDAILMPEFELSGYDAAWTEEETGEWLMQVDEQGIVTSCSRTGGKRGWQLYGISRWSKEDGRRLRMDLEEQFERKGNRQIYWDDVAMFCYPEHFRMGIFPIKKEDILEIDSYEELVEVDPSYAKA